MKMNYKSESEIANNSVIDTSGQESKEESLFKTQDYFHFVLGVILIGGLLVIPFTYGWGMGLRYVESLPWSLASCSVFLIVFRRNGTISWGRFVPVMALIMFGTHAYNLVTGRPAFAAGGFFGMLLMVGCGYAGIAVGRVLNGEKQCLG